MKVSIIFHNNLFKQQTENGWFIPGRGCGVSTKIKYRNYLPQDIDNEKHECTFVAIPSGDNTPGLFVFAKEYIQNKITYV